MSIGVGVYVGKLNKSTGTPAPVPAKLGVLTQPDNINASGTAFSQQAIIEIQDTNGNRVTTANNSVVITIASGPGALGGTITLAAVNGVVTYTNVSLSGAGFNTLTFSSGALTPITSGLFANGPQTRHMIASGSFVDASKWDNSGLLPHYTVDTLIIDGGVAATNNSSFILGNDGLTTSKRFQQAATASFDHQSGTITWRAPLQYDGLFKISGTAVLNMDSSTNKLWPIGPSAAGSTAIFQMLGASKASRCTFACTGNADVIFSNTNGSNQSGWDIENANINDMGRSATYWWIFKSGGATQKFRHKNVLTNRCSDMTPQGIPATADFDLQNWKNANSIGSASSGFQFQGMAAATTGLRIFKNCGLKNTPITSFDVSMKGFDIEEIYIKSWRAVAHKDNQLPTTFERVLVYNGAMVYGAPSFIGRYVYSFMDAQAISGSFASYTANASDAGLCRWDGSIIETNDGFSAADGETNTSVLVTSGAGYVIEMDRTINLMNPKGKASSGLSTGHDTPDQRRRLRHNTQSLVDESSGTWNTGAGAVNVCQTHSLEKNRANIYYRYGTVGTQSRGIIDYATGDIATGEQATHGLIFTSDATGNSSTTFKCTGKTFETDTRWWMANAKVAAELWIVDNFGIVGAPAIGEHHPVTSNTANTVTASTGFTGLVFAGIKVAVIVGDKTDPAETKDNVYSGCYSGKCYDLTGQPIADVLAHTGFFFSAPPDTSYYDYGFAVTDPIAGGPKFLVDEATGYCSLNFADQKWMGFGVATPWVTGTFYAQGSIVSSADAGFWASSSINWRAKVDHTSGASTQPGHNAGSSTFYNTWEPAALCRMEDASVDEQIFSDPAILLYGDTAATPANNATPLQMQISRVRHTKRPTDSNTLTKLDTDVTSPYFGICAGAVDGNIPLP